MNTIDVVAAIIIKDNKVLLSTRPNGKHYEGYWEFPGGKVENNESKKVALKREILEELGVEIAVKNLFEVIEHSYSEKRVRVHFYLATPINKASFIPIGVEGQQVRFFATEEIELLKIIPADVDISQKVCELISNL